ncbi:MAG: hypothetical protein H6751_01665 [Candidatus Omnitrophica bacterium]|nr:hypothetical protein [Candidatus Omnitrophota bacterium]MCB9781656.1 hypothetical protein [Candidatus Omnitrophota bacterium]
MRTSVLLFLTFSWLASLSFAENEGLSDSLEGTPPILGCWFWHESEFEPEGYRPYLDLIAEKSPFDILTTSLRVKDRELVDPETRSQVKEAVEYARSLGVGIALDLDVRLARGGFREKFPDEQQWMIRLRDVQLDELGRGEISIESAHLSDHYTHRTTPYIPLSGRVERIFLFERGPGGVLPGTVHEIDRKDCGVVAEGTDEVSIRVDLGKNEAGKTLCLAAGFEHFTPAVFAPHLLEYQEGLLELYGDLPLAGACKDEWGFPPDFKGCPDKNDYWYSTYRAEAYREEMDGRDLIRDFLLMTYGEEGKEAERVKAINHFMRMSYRRNGEIETQFYRATKKVFGQDALVATHPTWYPFPGVQEFKKNGLDWWIAKRDLAQTDESTPYSVRTSLAKKWGSRIWCNMYYSEDPEDYVREMWRGALSGGRINYHPPWPTTQTGSLMAGQKAVLGSDRMRGEVRVRLLDFISDTPLDCPVAVIFGHAAAMNWSHANYAETGVALADGFWRSGRPADLIPSSEIWNGSLRMGEDGRLRYGPQSYDVAVLINPEFEPAEAIPFLEGFSPERTTIFLLGDRTMDFEGHPTERLSQSWPKDRMVGSKEEALEEGLKRLREMGVASQSPATEVLKDFGYESAAPSRHGMARLIDGTHLFIHGEKSASGDRVASVFQVDGHEFQADFEGVLGVRFDNEGQVVALAAGGLKSFRSNNLTLALDKRLDFALKRNQRGEIEGIYYNESEAPPKEMEDLGGRWTWKQFPRTLATRPIKP